MGKTVRDIITGRTVVSVKPTDSVREAARAMYEKDVGAVLVMEGERLRGIFTERDALRFFAATRRNPYIIDVEVVMTSTSVHLVEQRLDLNLRSQRGWLRSRSNPIVRLVVHRSEDGLLKCDSEMRDAVANCCWGAQ